MISGRDWLLRLPLAAVVAEGQTPALGMMGIYSAAVLQAVECTSVEKDLFGAQVDDCCIRQWYLGTVEKVVRPVDPESFALVALVVFAERKDCMRRDRRSEFVVETAPLLEVEAKPSPGGPVCRKDSLI